MSFFNDVSSIASNLANKAGRKTRMVADTTRLNMKISGLESDINRCLTEIGRLYYDAYELGVDVSLDACTPHCETVADARRQIAELKDEIERIKAEDKAADEQEIKAKEYGAKDAVYEAVFDDNEEALFEAEAQTKDEATAPVETDFDN